MSDGIGFDWSANMLEGLRQDDDTPNRIATRTAERIIAKGFSLTFVDRIQGHREGFMWGRSSHAVSRKTIWAIHFEDDNCVEYVVNVVVAVTTYTKENPYDRLPRNNGVPSAILLADNEAKRVLGWQATSEDEARALSRADNS